MVADTHTDNFAQCQTYEIYIWFAVYVVSHLQSKLGDSQTVFHLASFTSTKTSPNSFETDLMFHT